MVRGIVGNFEDENPYLVGNQSSSLYYSCSTQLSMKFIVLINVKTPTIVGFLTFMSRISLSVEYFQARKKNIFQYFSFYKQFKFYAQNKHLKTRIHQDTSNKYQQPNL